jgi:hypothetical protein
MFYYQKQLNLLEAFLGVVFTMYTAALMLRVLFKINEIAATMVFVLTSALVFILIRQKYGSP